MEGVGRAVVGCRGGLDGGGEDALDADAVAAHDGGDFFAVAIEDGGSHGLRVLVAKLEDMTDLDRFAQAQRLASDRIEFAFGDIADVGDQRGFEVASGRDVAEVVLLFVGSGDEIGAAFESLVEDDEGAGFLWVRSGFDPDGAEVTCGGFEGGLELFRRHGTDLAARDCDKLGLVEGVVAAQEDYDRAGFAQFGVVGFREVGGVSHGLDLVLRGDLEEGSDLFDGALAGGVDQFGLAVAGWSEVFHWREAAGGLLDVGGVARGAAGDEIFAGFGVDHEFLRAGAAHGSGVRLDGDEFKTAPGEDVAIGLVMLLVGEIEAGVIDIEGVGVLHDELADAEEAGFGAGLVAELGLDLIPDLGELLVAAELVASDGGHDFFVSHGEAELCALAVLETEHILAHDGPAAGLFPDFARV